MNWEQENLGPQEQAACEVLSVVPPWQNSPPMMPWWSSSRIAPCLWSWIYISILWQTAEHQVQSVVVEMCCKQERPSAVVKVTKGVTHNNPGQSPTVTPDPCRHPISARGHALCRPFMNAASGRRAILGEEAVASWLGFHVVHLSSFLHACVLNWGRKNSLFVQLMTRQTSAALTASQPFSPLKEKLSCLFWNEAPVLTDFNPDERGRCESKIIYIQGISRNRFYDRGP